MAKVKFSALISEMRNKLNGSVFSKNRAGNYLRNKVTPVNPNTSFQALSRSRLAARSQAWSSLGESVINSWNAATGTFAKTDIFGDLKNPTGKNLYTSLNINLSKIGAANITTPPLPVAVAGIVGMVPQQFDVSVPSFSLEWDSGAIPANTAWLVEATAGLSPGVRFVKSEYRVIATLPAATATTVSIVAAYEAKFGLPTVGTNVWVRVTPISTTTGISGIAVTNYNGVVA